ncbi:MAG: hypothetical protein RR614_09405 [Eubacterium sp.]
MEKINKKGLFPFEEEKDSFELPEEKEAMIKEIWKSDEVAFMNYIIGLLQ